MLLDVEFVYERRGEEEMLLHSRSYTLSQNSVTEPTVPNLDEFVLLMFRFCVFPRQQNCIFVMPCLLKHTYIIVDIILLRTVGPGTNMAKSKQEIYKTLQGTILPIVTIGLEEWPDVATSSKVQFLRLSSLGKLWPWLGSAAPQRSS